MPAGLAELSAAPYRVRRIPTLAALAVMIVLAGCGGDSEPEPTSTTAGSTTATSSTTTFASSTTTTTAATSTTTAPPDTTEAAADFDVSVDTYTQWGEVFDALTATEHECIRDTFDADLLESVLARPVISESDTPEAWEVSMFSCLAPQTARAVFLGLLVAGMEEDGLFLIDADAQACLDEWVAGIDVVATMVALSADDAEVAGEVTTAFMRCNPDLFISLMLEETGMTLDDLSPEEATCLREWAAGTDWATLATGPTDEPSAATLLVSLLDCAPDALLRHPGGWRWNDAIQQAVPVEIGVATPGELEYEDSDLFAFEATEGEIYDLDVTLEDCILDIYDADGTLLTSRHYCSYTAPVMWQASTTGTFYVRVTSLETGAYTLTVTLTDILDDHPNAADRATPVEIGVAAHGELDYEGDSDFFTFEAAAAFDTGRVVANTEGKYYDLVLTLGTLQESLLDIYDADGSPVGSALITDAGSFWLADSYQRGDAPSRLLWRARVAGTYYVQVTNPFGGTGTYTLTVSDVEDPPNVTANATPVEIGVASPGKLEYEGDIGFFSFEAEEGNLYELDTTLDSHLAMYDTDGTRVGSLVDNARDVAIWHAPSTGTYYVEATSFDTGAYTLTIAVSDIVDDHPNWIANATPVEIGVGTLGELDYESDVDFFTFEATEGELYELDVTLGTLQDPFIYVYDANGTWLDTNDLAASRLVWLAPSTGTYYVGVAGGFSTGTYTLTIEPS